MPLCLRLWGFPTPAHLGAPGEEAAVIPGVSWQPRGCTLVSASACEGSACTSLTSHWLNRLTPKSRNHIQDTNLTNSVYDTWFQILSCGEKHGWKGEKIRVNIIFLFDEKNNTLSLKSI